jgi:hypothetical protein
MSTPSLIPSELSRTTIQNTASLLRIVALALISGAAIASRLFAVINFESIIHELCAQLFDLPFTKLIITMQRSMVQLVSCCSWGMSKDANKFEAGQRKCWLRRVSTSALQYFLTTVADIRTGILELV